MEQNNSTIAANIAKAPAENNIAQAFNPGVEQEASIPIFYCPNCKQVPKMEVQDDYSIKISCTCYENKKRLSKEDSDKLNLNELCKYRSYIIDLNKFLDTILNRAGEPVYCSEELKHKSGPQKAKFYCCDCMVFFCEDCYNGHKIGNTDHIIIESYGLKINANCEQKGCKTNAKRKFYCSQCKLSLCYSCAYNKHAGHKDVSLIDDMIDENKLKALYEKVEKIYYKMGKYYQIYKDFINKLTENLNEKKKKDLQLIEYYKILIKMFETTQKGPDFNIRSNLLHNDIDNIFILTNDYFHNQLLNTTKQFIYNSKFKFQKSKIEAEYDITNPKTSRKILGDSFKELSQENCSLYIDGKLIPFTKKYHFLQPGKARVEFEFKEGFQIKNMSNMFTDTDIYKVDLSKIESRNVTDMSYMFDGCSKLISVDFTSFNTRKVTNMRGLFSGCSSLESVDLTSFNTENVTDMSYIFLGCSKLNTVNLTSFNTGKVTNMACFFEGCTNLSHIDLSSFNTSNVTDMQYMFQKCSKLGNLNLSSFNTENVNNMRGLFSECSSLENVDLSSFNTSNVLEMKYMFNMCHCLNTLNLANFNTVNVTNFSYLFSECEALTQIDVSNFNTSNATDISYMFNNCSSIAKLNLSSFKTEKVTNMKGVFSGCSSLESLDVSSFNTANVTDLEGMFNSCYKIKGLNLTGFITSNVINMSGLFSDCSALEKVDLSSFKTPKVESITDMFNGCCKLKEADLSGFDTSKVDSMSGMFNECNSLTLVKLTSFNTENVTDMSWMFNNCTSLISLNLSSFKTQKVTTMKNMFSGCMNLSDLNVNSFYVTKSTNVENILDGCTLVNKRIRGILVPGGPSN